jgi:hypothetical protein
MKETYDMTLEALRKEIETDGARPIEIDKMVSLLLANGNENIAADLLASLSDNAAYDEGMFTLIHAAESLDDDKYVHSLLSVFSRLAETAPRWASIVLMRVLNSESTRREIVAQLREAAVPIKQAVRVMCERINAVSPQFLSKTTPVLIAAS